MSARNISLTLIVACSPSNGIGKDGGLPWRLKREMAYFRHVTSHLPRGAAAGSQNAVLMGRNTWLSIPPRFRPLAGRVNVVLSQSQDAASLATTGQGAFHCRTLDQAASLLQTQSVARVFLIGGAELYSSFLRQPEQGGFLLDRLLVTRIVSPEFACDTFLPAALPGSNLAGEATTEHTPREWRQASPEELLDWVPSAANLPPALQAMLASGSQGLQQTEGEVQYELQMWV